MTTKTFTLGTAMQPKLMTELRKHIAAPTLRLSAGHDIAMAVNGELVGQAGPQDQGGIVELSTKKLVRGVSSMPKTLLYLSFDGEKLALRTDDSDLIMLDATYIGPYPGALPVPASASAKTAAPAPGKATTPASAPAKTAAPASTKTAAPVTMQDVLDSGDILKLGEALSRELSALRDEVWTFGQAERRGAVRLHCGEMDLELMQVGKSLCVRALFPDGFKLLVPATVQRAISVSLGRAPCAAAVDIGNRLLGQYGCALKTAQNAQRRATEKVQQEAAQEAQRATAATPAPASETQALIDKLRAQVDKLTEELADQAEERKTAQQQIRTAEADLAEEEKRFDEAGKEHTQELAERDAELVDLVEELAERPIGVGPEVDRAEMAKEWLREQIHAKNWRYIVSLSAKPATAQPAQQTAAAPAAQPAPAPVKVVKTAPVVKLAPVKLAGPVVRRPAAAPVVLKPAPAAPPVRLVTSLPRVTPLKVPQAPALKAGKLTIRPVKGWELPMLGTTADEVEVPASAKKTLRCWAPGCCRKPCDNEKQLRNHFVSAHVLKDDGDCPICGDKREIRDAAHLQNHMKLHREFEVVQAPEGPALRAAA